jgi:Tol biopolymer transport system component
VDTHIGSDIPANAAQEELFLAVPGSSAANWSVSRILQSQLDWPNETPSWPAIALSPDQTKLAFTVGKCIGDYHCEPLTYGADNIYVYDLQNGALTKITNDSPLAFGGLSWQRDSQSLIYAWGKELYLLRLDGSPAEQLTPSFERDVSIVTTSPDANHLLVRQAYDGFLFNQSSHELTQVPCSEGVWSPDNQWLACTNQGGFYLFLFNTSTGQEIQLMEPDHYSAETWSPAASQLAYTEYERESAHSILWLWNNATETTHQLFTGDSISKPIWSPDGSKLFISYHSTEETAQLLILDAITGSTQDLELPSDMQPFRPISWSPDGEWLLFSGIYTPRQNGVGAKDHFGLFILNRNGSNPYLVYNLGEENIYRGHWLAELELFWLSSPPPQSQNP